MQPVRAHRSSPAKPHHQMHLGPFEARVMELLWKIPGCTVHQVKDKLARKRAYTTVLTTMVRLFHKGMLSRRKQGHQFVYSPQISAEDWGKLAAAEFVDQFAAVPNVTHELLVSSLVEALDRLDPKLPLKMKAELLAKRPKRVKNDSSS